LKKSGKKRLIVLASAFPGKASQDFGCGLCGWSEP
jgi:hypothetical protein